MNKICRICLEEGVLSSVFVMSYNISLCDMVEYCSNIKISKGDGLPEQMCSNCVYKLGIAYHFKQTCESADVRLRQYLGLRMPNKFSDASIQCDPVPPVQHTIIKKCKCRIMQCKKSSSNYKKKPESEKLKRGPKPKPKKTLSCFQCDKEFRCQAQLEMHERTHTGDKPYGCMYCPRRFTQKHNLTIHVRTHTGEKPFQCEMCSKTFSAQGNLQAHLKIHTGQKDHVCSICNKSFITSSELTRHMSKHRGVKNFKCDLCDAAYVHSRDLKLHKSKKHQMTLNSKTQNDNFNNTNTIDIIGVDEGKDNSVPLKDNTHHLHFVNHLNDEKNQQNDSIIHNQHNHSLVPYDHKGIKNVMERCPTKSGYLHSCDLCGEEFTYLSALAQHYLNQHKECSLTTKMYNMQ